MEGEREEGEVGGRAVPLNPPWVRMRAKPFSVRLSIGELEVLATSLLDEQKYPTADFFCAVVRSYHFQPHVKKTVF